VKRLAVGLLVAWFVALAFVYQQHSHPAPRVLHARPLEPADANLPTLAPLSATPSPGPSSRQ
jgi:hypothetical protein